MAEQKPNAALRPIRGVRRSATRSGVIHVRAYQPKRYTIVGDHLAQHRELSLTAIGLALHIMSLPEGAPVDIRSLAERFSEGRTRIAFGLRELEAHGYLERVRERTEKGQVVTRTYVHHLPGCGDAEAGREEERGEEGEVRREPSSPAPVSPASVPVPAPAPAPVPAAAPVPASVPVPSGVPADPPSSDIPGTSAAPATPSAPPAGHHARAVALLAGLRRTDDRLTLSRRDVLRLVPAVTAWFDAGVTADAVHRALTADLPPDLRHPAGLVAHRLRELLPPPLPPAASALAPADAGPPPRRPHPFQTCDGCERAFRAPAPGRCRDCRSGRAAGEPSRAA
jgi:hypothetical protein